MYDQQSVSEEQPRDAMLSEQMAGQAKEAAERVTFHRVELERWERIGRAAAAASNHLNACAPVASQSPEDFYADSPGQNVQKALR